MGLKAVVNSLDGIPAEYHSLYKQVGDDFVLDIDDKDYKDRINEFRDNNVDLLKKAKAADGLTSELATLKKALEGFDGMDAEKAKVALDTMQKLQDQKMIAEGDLEGLLNQRTDRMRSDHEGQKAAFEKLIETLTVDRDTYKTKLTDVTIDSSLQKAVSEVAAVRPNAMIDVLHRGKQIWSLDDKGDPIPTGPDGKVMYGTDGQSQLTMTEWAQTQVQDTPHLFETNSGGGASGNSNSSGSGSSVEASDQSGINNSIEAIAAGEVQVTRQQ